MEEQQSTNCYLAVRTIAGVHTVGNHWFRGGKGGGEGGKITRREWRERKTPGGTESNGRNAGTEKRRKTCCVCSKMDRCGIHVLVVCTVWAGRSVSTVPLRAISFGCGLTLNAVFFLQH